MTEERRKVPRRRTLKGGRIVINNGHSTFDCTIRNLSDAGTKLIVTSSLAIPNRFELAMDDGRHFACEVAWRTETELGVQFIPA